MSLFGRKNSLRKSLRAVGRVDRYRLAAESLRTDDPATYWGIVEGAAGSDVEKAARDDPDAYVALFLAELQDAGVISGESKEAPATKSDRDYWPDLDLEKVRDSVAEFFTQDAAAKGAEQLVYPKWAIRRFISHEVLREAASIEPKIYDDLLALTGGRSVMEDDPRLAEGFDALLRKYHLEEPVEVVTGAFVGP